MFNMPGRSYSGKLPPLTDDEAALRDRLYRHVDVLAGLIGERHVGKPDSLANAAHYVATTLAELDYHVSPQPFDTHGQTVANLDCELPGSSHPQEILVVGAHYDSVRRCPAANDNATGVAAMLEIARALRGRALPRTVRFVAFVNEEPPYFHTELMGSLGYARRCRQRRENVVGMITPETIGCYTDEPDSQRYPFGALSALGRLAGLGLPSAGNFIGFVANTFSNNLLRAAIGSFRRHTRFPSEGYAAPGEMLGLSDHWSFWQAGYPAVMVTDTAPFRYAHYHTPDDTPDKIDFDRTARVVAGLTRVVEDLAGAR